MSTQNFEKDLKKSLKDQRIDIADNGFSERVMQHLPEKRKTYWIVTVFTIIGVTLTYFLGGINNLISLFNMMFGYFAKINLPYINLSSIIAILVVLVLLIFYMEYEENTI